MSIAIGFKSMAFCFTTICVRHYIDMLLKTEPTVSVNCVIFGGSCTYKVTLAIFLLAFCPKMFGNGGDL